MQQVNTIKVFTTSHCNLNCKHCYQFYEKNKYELPLSKLIEIVDFALENSTKVIDFSGGEFLVHPFAYELLDYCFDKNIKVNVATNAIKMDINFFQKYRDLDLLTVQVSVDGNKNTHDNRRGTGTYDLTLTNIKKLSDIGIPVTISMALDEENYLDALDVLNLPNIEKFIFMPVALTGAAGINCSKDISEEYENTIIEIMKIYKCEFEGFNVQFFPNSLAVKYDGNVYLSPVASDYGLLPLGNIFEQSLKEIVSNYMVSDEYKSLISISQSDIEECTDCPSKSICDGGCRMRALKFFGDILKPDPFYCRLYENRYKEIPIGKLFWGEK